jgi:flagellar basal-body rod modification protein FlgD
MTTVSPTAQQNFIQQFVQPTERKPQIENVQDRFLKLLVTQLNNQDPLNPMDNAQVTTQMAQISTVTGIEKLNGTVGDMMSSFMAAQSVQAGSLIGRGVLGEGSTLLLEQNGATAGAVLGQAADRVTVNITAPSGQLVRTLELGAQRPGTLTFSWNGVTDAGTAAPPGAYQFEVKAIQQGKAVDAQPLGFGRVQSVTLGGEGLTLETQGLGPLSLDQVKRILQ